MSSFDGAANNYDCDFTHSPIGKIQRKQVLDYLNPRLTSGRLDILEVNCGTGEDAVWMAKKGHNILCTDVSTAMLSALRSKVKAEHLEQRINIQQLDLRSLGTSTVNGEFDLIFSNFAGLNCLAPAELEVALEQLTSYVKPNGSLVLVFLGRFCAWETKYFLLKGKWKTAFRRWSKKAVYANVEGEQVATWYYSMADVKKLASKSLKHSGSKAIGTYVPPSYMNPWFKNRPTLLAILYKLDQLFGTSSIFTGLSDHYLIELRKA